MELNQKLFEVETDKVGLPFRSVITYTILCDDYMQLNIVGHRFELRFLASKREPDKLRIIYCLQC